MLRGIAIYFLLTICLLSKDGMTMLVDSIHDSHSISMPTDISFDDASEEEEVSEDLWHFTSSGMEDIPLGALDFTNQLILTALELNFSQVHLERIIPPPNKA
ncbi:MAG: hypothetical protein RLZZ474_1981 [Bacteroidota bacterium]|jgi:hypothetical protein